MVERSHGNGDGIISEIGRRCEIFISGVGSEVGDEARRRNRSLGKCEKGEQYFVDWLRMVLVIIRHGKSTCITYKRLKSTRIA